MDNALRSALGAVAIGVLGLLGGPAHAEVTLQTSVNKVKATLDENGRVRRELLPADAVLPGEELRYTITFTNASEAVVDAERIVITNPVPDGTRYVPGSAGGEWSVVEYSSDGESYEEVEPEPPAEQPADGQPPVVEAGAGPVEEGGVRSLRWTYRRDLPPGGADEVFFHVRMQ